MEIEPVAIFHSPLKEKFGLPRQSGITPSLKGEIHLTDGFRRSEALKGIDGFDYLWLIWGFNQVAPSNVGLTVRPPRLGGNERVGVFASRSPFRPNRLGLSSVKVEAVDFEGCTIQVSGADLADGTPIYDIKPYVEYADSHCGVRSGFVDGNGWPLLDVYIPDGIASELGEVDIAALKDILSQDPRPAFQRKESGRTYGITFNGRNLHFTVEGETLKILDCTQ